MGWFWANKETACPVDHKVMAAANAAGESVSTHQGSKEQMGFANIGF